MQPLVEFDSARFNERFNRLPFGVTHGLQGHPLFELPQLVELAQRLPAGRVEYNAGDVPVSLDPGRTPLNGLSATETVRRIEECRSWMVLKNVECVPEYRQLLDQCLQKLREHAERVLPGVHMPEAFVFVSSPGSVTPFHIDPEHNFLFQLCGQKTIHVFDAADRELVGARDLERFYAGAHRNLPFHEDWQARASTWRLGPGDGVHVPVTAPHWVRNGDAVSVSFSVTFRSRSSRRQADVWQMNHRLRALGFDPAPPGASQAGDLVKQIANRALRGGAALAERLSRPFVRGARA